MIRARIRSDGMPAYSFVMRVIKAYQNSRRAFTSPSYLALRAGADPILHRNWKHYVRCAKVIADLNITPEDYMQTLFVEATVVSYPRPNNLYSKTSIARAKSRSVTHKEILLVHVNEDWLAHAVEHDSSMPEELLVLFPWVAYSDWFRVYHGRVKGINPACAKRAREQLDDEFSLALEDLGYDLGKLTDKINKVLNDR